MFKKALIFAVTMSFSLLSDATPEQNAQICASCHGANGKSSIPTYPHLAGQNKLYIEAQLNAFKTGTRKSPIMSPMAASLTDDEIKSLAEYYSKI